MSLGSRADREGLERGAGSAQDVRLRAEPRRGDTGTCTHASCHLPAAGAKATAARQGSHQGLRETFQEVGPASLCEALLSLLRATGPAR